LIVADNEIDELTVAVDAAVFVLLRHILHSSTIVDAVKVAIAWNGINCNG